MLKQLRALLLLALVLMKVSSFHTYQHIDDEAEASHCELCILTIQNQNSEALPLSFSSLELVAPEVGEPQKFTFKEQVTVNSPENSHFFTRPPPTLL